LDNQSGSQFFGSEKQKRSAYQYANMLLNQLLQTPDVQQIMQLAQAQVPVKPEAGGGLMSGHVGLIGGLLNGLQGKGFNPMAQKTEPFGITNAIALKGAINQGQKQPLEIEKLQGDISQQPLQQRKLEQETNSAFQVEKAKSEAQAKGSFLTANDIFTKFEAASQPFIVQRDAYSRIKEAGNEPSAAGDLALIYGYMKILDPGSTVREGEFATAQNSGSIPQRIQALYNKVATGKRLETGQRNDFLNRSERIYKSAEAQFGGTRKRFTKLAIANKLDPEAVTANISLEESGTSKSQAKLDTSLPPELQALAKSGAKIRLIKKGGK